MKTIPCLALALLLFAGSFNEVGAHSWRSRCFSHHGGYSNYQTSYSYFPRSYGSYPGYGSYGAYSSYRTYPGCQTYPSYGAYPSYGVNSNYGVNSSYGAYPNYGVTSSYGAYPSYGVNPNNGMNPSYGAYPGNLAYSSNMSYTGRNSIPSIMNVLGASGLGGATTGQSSYLSLPVGMGNGQTGYLQVPVGSTAGRGSYLQIPVNSGYGPPTFMQIELGRGSGDVLPNSSAPGNAPVAPPSPSYGQNSSLFDNLASNIRKTSDDDVPPVAVGSEQNASSLALLSPQADTDPGQYVLTKASTVSTSPETSFSLTPSNPEASTPSLPFEDGIPWVAK